MKIVINKSIVNVITIVALAGAQLSFAAQKKPTTSKGALEALLMTGSAKPQPKTKQPKPTKKEKKSQQKVDAPMNAGVVEQPHAQAQPQPVQMPAVQNALVPAPVEEKTQFRKMAEIIDPEMYENLKKAAHARKEFFGTQAQELNKLLAQGYSAYARNSNGMAIISDAIVAQSFELVQLLCQAGAQLDVFQPVINKTPYQIAYDMKDENSQTKKIWELVDSTLQQTRKKQADYKPLAHAATDQNAAAGTGAGVGTVDVVQQKKQADQKARMQPHEYRFKRANTIIKILGTQSSAALEKELKALYFKAVKVGDLKTVLAIRQVPDSKRFAVEDVTGKTALIYFAQSDNPKYLADLIAQGNNIIYEDILLKDNQNKGVFDYLDAKMNMKEWQDIIEPLSDAYQHMACIEDESNHDDDKQNADAAEAPSEALQIAVPAAAAGQGVIDKEPAALADSWTQEFAAGQVKKPMPKINPVTEDDLQKWEKQEKTKKQQNDSKPLTSAQRRKARRDEIEHKNERKKAQEKLQREQQRKAEQERVNALKAQQKQAQEEAARMQQEQAQEQEIQNKIEAHKKAERERAETDLQDRLAQRAQEKEAQRLKEQHEREQQEKAQKELQDAQEQARKAAELARQQEQAQKDAARKAQEDADRKRAAQEQDERDRREKEERALQQTVGRIRSKKSLQPHSSNPVRQIQVQAAISGASAQHYAAAPESNPQVVDALHVDHKATQELKQILQNSTQEQQQAHEKLFKAVAFGDLEGIRNSGVQDFNIKDIFGWDPIRALMFEFKNAVCNMPFYNRYKESLKFLLQQNISLKDLGNKERSQLIADARIAFRVDENTDLLGQLADYCKKQENYLLYSELKDVKHEIETSRQKGINNLWSAYAQKLQESELGSYYWAHYFKSRCQHYAAGLIPVPANTALTAQIAPQAPAVLLPTVQQHNAPQVLGAGLAGNGVRK